MKYSDSQEKSGEFLRRTIPLMRKQTAAFHPISYAVWYEYVAGINPLLTASLDEMMKTGLVLDEEVTHSLYQKHIAEIDEEVAKRVSSGFQRVLADMSHSAAQAGDQAHKFGAALEQWSGGLGEDAGVGKLREDTQQMQGAIASLNGRLNQSQQEIERLRQEVSRARQDALADGLTGLTNRKGFDLAMASCLSSIETGVRGPSLLMTDIDFFKKVNDSYGHLFGDKVIRVVAQTLKDNVKGKDLAARYGGEEFVILLPDTPVEGARILAEKLRATVENGRIRRLDSNETIAKVTISLGVAAYRPGESAAEFIERADQALYASKTQGRNRVTVAQAN
ncbi:MAG: diguanylate cyclase [Sulfuricella sp.]|nr:diguanylate cyclase [Sulfuricella sp.]